MKTSFLVILSSLVLGSFAQANGTQNATQNAIVPYLPYLLNRVENCSINAYTVQNGVKSFHALISHCPEVKVVATGVAKVKVAGQIFQIDLVETERTDGDIYDVVIRNVRTLDEYRIYGVMAYGDVLLGVLKGNTSRLPQVQVQLSNLQDQFLKH